MNGWTQQDIDKKVVSGKIRGHVMKERSVDVIVKEKVKKFSIEKVWITATLKMWCKKNGFVLLHEHRVVKGRKWSFDWVIDRRINPAISISHRTINPNIAIEYEGLFSKKSGHTTVTGYTNNCSKYNAASLQGYTLLRYTAMNYKDLVADLNKLNED